MESAMGLVINFVWSSVWRGWQVQSSSDSLCHRWCSGRWRVGWSPGTLDAPSCVVSCPPTACFACPHQSSPLFEQHSAMHCGRLLSASLRSRLQTSLKRSAGRPVKCSIFVTEWRRFLLALFRSDLVKQIVNDQTSKVQLFTEFITDILYVHDVSSL